MHMYFLSVWYSQSSSMVNIFGDSVGEEGQFLGNLQVVRKLITTSGNYVDYLNEIQASLKLGFPAYRIAHHNNSPTLIFTYEKRFLLRSSWS